MLKATEIKENALQSQRLEGKMLKEHHHKVIKELHAKGIAKREIARTLGLDIKTNAYPKSTCELSSRYGMLF